MKYLSELTGGMFVVDSTVKKEMPIEGLSQNSEKVEKNYMFFVSGKVAEKHIDDALKRGATVLVGEKIYPQAPCLVVSDIRKAVAAAARAFYDFPDRGINIIGVLGTNGKTTVTHILGHMFNSCGMRSAVIGTLGVFIGSDRYETNCTTPDSADFFRFLREAADKKVKFVFVEVSAHAVYYRKLYGVKLDIGVFTNFSQDHLDFFRTMERYRAVKNGFFERENMKCAVVNTDDDMGREIYLRDYLCCVGYGIYNPADVFAIDIRYGNGTDFMINAFDDVVSVHTSLFGEFNVSNILAAISVGKIYGLKMEDMASALLSLSEIDGRFNVIHWRSKIIIDYAHTPDGMEKMLSCAKKMCAGKLICVFGCGGNRDKTKRPIMGKIATQYADVTVITSDNPREEDPEEIISEIKSGVTKEVYCVPDRTEAVNLALELSQNGDIVLILGKGGEKYIERKGKKVPYSDGETCHAYIGSHPCHA